MFYSEYVLFSIQRVCLDRSDLLSYRRYSFINIECVPSFILAVSRTDDLVKGLARIPCWDIRLLRGASTRSERNGGEWEG